MTVRLDRMAPLQERIAKFVRGIGVRQIRLACGLVLFAYLVSPFPNPALGNVSMDALAAGLYYHIVFWQFLPVAIAFYTAALVHTGLGIWALYERRQFPLKTEGAAAARARLEHPGAYHHPYCRRAARPDAFRT